MLEHIGVSHSRALPVSYCSKEALPQSETMTVFLEPSQSGAQRAEFQHPCRKRCGSLLLDKHETHFLEPSKAGAFPEPKKRNTKSLAYYCD